MLSNKMKTALIIVLFVLSFYPVVIYINHQSKLPYLSQIGWLKLTLFIGLLMVLYQMRYKNRMKLSGQMYWDFWFPLTIIFFYLVSVIYIMIAYQEYFFSTVILSILNLSFWVSVLFSWPYHFNNHLCLIEGKQGKIYFKDGVDLEISLKKIIAQKAIKIEYSFWGWGMIEPNLEKSIILENKIKHFELSDNYLLDFF